MATTPTTRDDLNYALRMYGDATLAYARHAAIGATGNSPEAYEHQIAYDNMVFWQNQVWQCAQAIAANA
jgi:hypothetical protein